MQNGQIDRFQNGTHMVLQPKLLEVIRKYTDRDLNLESHFIDQLNFDSLMVVEFIMDLEETFDIDISDDEVSKIFQVKHAVELLERKLNANV